METKSYHIAVGVFIMTLAVLAGGFIFWLVGSNAGQNALYDIYFKNSVAGLTAGNVVRFNGVPVGQVTSISLVPQKPELVRVRIRIEQDTPVVKGTYATLEAQGLTGGVYISLSGSVQGAKKLTAREGQEVPVIPTQPSSLQKLFSNTPNLIRNANVAVDRFAQMLNEKNLKSIQEVLKSLSTITQDLAKQSPDMARSVDALDETIIQLRVTGEALATLADNTNQLLSQEGREMARDSAQAARQVKELTSTLNRIAAQSEGGIVNMSQTAMPELSATLREIRTASAAVNQMIANINKDGIAANLMRGENLPEYDPVE